MMHLLTLALGLALSLNAAGQSTQEDWYQVEVIIFTQTDNYGQERNLPPRHLSYPLNRVFLDNQHSIEPEELQLLSAVDQQLYQLLVPTTQLRYRPADHITPYHSVPSEERLLGPEAYTLNRHGDYQVLFHDSWFQSLAPASQTPWIVIQGGRLNNGHYQLEGSLRVHRSRFLSVETNLWHPHFGEQQIASVSETSAADNNWQWPALPPRPQPPAPTLPDFLVSGIERETVSTGIMDTEVEARPGHQLVDLDTLQQTLRIDEQGLHYLDHPRLGMLIRVKQLESEEQPETD